MIVVDTNIIIYFYLRGEFTEATQRALEKDAHCFQLVVQHLGLLKGRQISCHRVTQAEAALLHEHQHGHAGNRFGHGIEAEDGVGGHLLLGGNVGHAHLFKMHHLATAGDQAADVR
jgi:hypothetical protein